MPELPELDAHAERLTASHSGAVLARFEPLSFTALKTYQPPPEAAVGKALDRVDRRGKHLLLRFGDLTYVVHLMQGGRLRPDTGRSRKPRGAVARWIFEGSHQPLLLTEAGTERRAGVWVIQGDAEQQPPLDTLGPEPDSIGVDQMSALLAEHPMRLHTFLRDQKILAGIGRRLANEICHRARLSPFARTAALGAEEVERLVAAIGETIAEGLADERAHDVMRPSRERIAAVHGRTGEACPVCGDVVREVAYRDYTVHYCATCQTDGRVLADNTTSKFLR